EQPWTPARNWLYPASFRSVVRVGLLGRAGSGGPPGLPAEVWVEHVFPWCARRWFEQPSSPGGGRAPALRGAALRAPSPSCKDDGEQSDGDGGSTRASTRASTGSSPSFSEVAGHAEATVLVEVFDSGLQHCIGAAGDPDSLAPHERGRVFLSAALLRQRLARGASGQRRPQSIRHSEGQESDSEERTTTSRPRRRSAWAKRGSQGPTTKRTHERLGQAVPGSVAQRRLSVEDRGQGQLAES
ncbi:unnamed protein product, partial [Prorocentrum cordatum]